MGSLSVLAPTLLFQKVGNRGACRRVARLAHPVLGQNFNIELGTAFFGCGVDQADQLGRMGHYGGLLGSAEAAIKVPKIYAHGQRAVAFALHVFADFVFGGVQQAIGVLAFNVEGECLFHGEILVRRAAMWAAGKTVRPTSGRWAMIRPMQQTPREQHATPHKDAIALLPEFTRLGLDRITLVNEGAQAHAALATLRQARAWGFDTESKPTFKVGEVSDGPHVLQLSTPERAWVFQLHDPECRAVAAELMALPGIAKAGFGLGDDRKRILHKLGVEPVGVLELNVVFRERGYRKDMGVKGAVAVLFGQRFIKSKKAATSNWAAPRLTESQLVYAANDAYAAIRVFNALGL